MTEILIVDDEPSICEMLCASLSSENYAVKTACNSKQALDIIAEKLPDVLLVDWMMPGMSGVELIRCLRAEPATQRLPIIMLTAKDQEHNKLEGLKCGADDYIVKPFSNKELSARIKALLRRSEPHKSQCLVTSGALQLDPQTHGIRVDGQEVVMTKTEFNLLYFLVTHEGQVFSRQQLLDSVWGVHKFVLERTVDVQVRRLRSLLSKRGGDDLKQCIQTVRSIGYRYKRA